MSSKYTDRNLAEDVSKYMKMIGKDHPTIVQSVAANCLLFSTMIAAFCFKNGFEVDQITPELYIKVNDSAKDLLEMFKEDKKAKS